MKNHQAASNTIEDDYTQPTEGITALHRGIMADFPDLWPYVDVALSVCSVLFLKDAADCPSAIFVGPSGCGKSTVVEMFLDYSRGYRSDNFTPTAFVTEAANLTEAQRREVDLLPRIRHKILLTSECGTLFRGKAEAQAELFKILTRVLDGRGYTRDAATGGARWYCGDYLFGWLGGTTEVSDDTWRTMSNLGSRIFFCRFPSANTVTTTELVKSATTIEPYKTRIERCAAHVSTFMETLDASVGFRGKPWELSTEDEHVLEWIARLSLLVAVLRGMNRSQDDDEAESPYRAFNIRVNVACGHALVHDREWLALADIVPVARLAIGSVPRGVSRLLHHLLTVDPFNRKEARAIVRPRNEDEWKGGSADLYIKMMTRAGVIVRDGHRYHPTEQFSWENPLDFKEISGE